MKPVFVFLMLAISAKSFSVSERALGELNAIEETMAQMSYEQINEVHDLRKDEVTTRTIKYNNGVPSLVTINNQLPSDKEVAEFEKEREERDGPPFTFRVDPESLTLESESNGTAIYHFSPIVLQDGETSKHSEKFTGVLHYDQADDYISFVQYEAIDSFRIAIMNVQEMDIQTNLKLINENLVTDSVQSKMRMSSVVLKLELEVDTQFEYGN